MDRHISLSSSVILAPRRAGLCIGQDTPVEVLVRIQAPDAPAGVVAARPPQALALVLDRSGSMKGAPLREAKRCAEYVVACLRPSDSVSLTKFDNRVDRLWPAAPLGDGVPQRAVISRIEAGGNTNLHGGWLEGVDTLTDVSGQGLKRVILLSDGQANEGLTDVEAIATQCAEWAARGITTSTYGLGDSFNEELMVAMARNGGGNHYYGDTAEDLMEPFQQELELLCNLCLRELRLCVTTPEGVEAEMLNRLPTEKGGWRLLDTAWGAEAWAVLRLSVPAHALPESSQFMSVLQVSVTGKNLEGEAIQLEAASLSLPLLSRSAFDSLVDDELVTRRLVELSASEALSSMRSAAEAGDWSKVDRQLEEASRRFAGNEWVSAMLEAMRAIASTRDRERAMKEMMYSSEKLSKRLASKAEGLHFSLADESESPAYMRRKTAQGKGNF